MRRSLVIPACVSLLAYSCTSPKSSYPPPSIPPPEPGPTVAASVVPTESVPADMSTAQQVATILTSIDERAARVEAFTATYNVQMLGVEQTVHLAYLPPNRARMVVNEGSKKGTTWAVDGTTTILMEGIGQPKVFRIPALRKFDSWELLDAALDSAFPVDSNEEKGKRSNPLPDLGSGPTINFMVLADPNGAHGLTEVSTNWTDHRSYFLSWLSPTAGWERARLEEGGKLRVSHGSTSATISMSTGLLDEMEHADKFRARLVEFREGADERQFDPPQLSPEVSDDSQVATSALQIHELQVQRSSIYTRIIASPRFKKGDWEELRRAIESVFSTFYQLALDKIPSTAGQGASEAADELVDWYRFYWKASANDSMNRIDIESACSKRRNEIERRLLDPANALIESLKFVGEGLPAAQVDQVRQIELDAVHEVFQKRVLEPFRHHLDDRLKAIRDAQ